MNWVGGWVAGWVNKMFDISRPHFHIQFSTYLYISYMWICIGIDSHVTQATKNVTNIIAHQKNFATWIILTSSSEVILFIRNLHSKMKTLKNS